METIRFIQSFANPFWDRVFTGITLLGEDYFIILVITWVYWCIRKDWGYHLGIACLTGIVLNVALKEIFHIPRPIGQQGIRSLRLETADGFSFPSGHTQNMATLSGTLALLFRRAPLYWIWALMTVLVAVSRLYLGVHFPVDVIAGGLIGTGWAWLICLVIDEGDWRQNLRIFILLGILIPAGLFFFPTHNYYKASGAALGFIAGYWIEKRYIRHEPQAGFWKRTIKYVLGIAVLLGIQAYCKKLLPAMLISDFIRYLLISVWVTIGAPLVFKVVLGGKEAGVGKRDGNERVGMNK